MEAGNAAKVAVETRSIAQQLEAARAAVGMGAPAFDVSTRIAGATSALASLGGQTGGQGLVFAPGPLVTPDLPVFLRANADSGHLARASSTAAGQASQVGSAAPSVPVSEAEVDGYNSALHGLLQEWPGMVARTLGKDRSS